MNTQSLIWQQLAAAYFGVLPLRTFEQWVYATNSLEATIGPEGYLALISQDYGSKYADGQLRACIDGFYLKRPAGELEREAARWVCRQFLAGELDLENTASLLGQFWSEELPWARSEFAYISSELSDMISPDVYARWEPAILSARLAEQEARVKEFHRAGREAAREIESALEHLSPAF
ncbi:MAG: hypothetical protein ABJE47_25935 [bacterium]